MRPTSVHHRPDRARHRHLAAALLVALSATSLVVVAPAGPADAAVRANADALALTTAMKTGSMTNVTAASFVRRPTTGEPTAIGNARPSLAGFPTSGGTYAILSTGNATAAGLPNSSESRSTKLGSAFRGAVDPTILKVTLNVPANANCLDVKFRLLSEEYPEYVGKDFNDAFVAELDNLSWSVTGPTVTAPANFAFDAVGNPVTINATTGMTAGNAAGTTYDGASPLLTARTPITPGEHVVYFSIFDVGDAIFDSTVFIDALRVYRSRVNCVAGVVQPSTVEILTPPSDSGPTDPQFVNNGFDAVTGRWYTDVRLEGRAFDSEDGLLTGASLVWTTDRTDLQPAALGEGNAINVRLYNGSCSGSVHTITLTSYDSQGNALSAPRRISVWRDCPPSSISITNPSADTSTQDNRFGYDGFDSAKGMWFTDFPFTGQAFDALDGTLTGSQLVWTTDRTDLQPAQLGTGTAPTVRLYSNDCFGLRHTITLTAKGPSQNVQVATRRVFIWTLC